MSKAALTRTGILEQAFGLTYKNGYQTTSIDEILATTQVTKGAFYYHFKNKDEMGLAMINEIMLPKMQQAFVIPLENSQNPIADIYSMIENLLLHSEVLLPQFGCPAGNLTQEMASANQEFSIALSELTLVLQNAIVACLENGKKTGKVATSVNSENTSLFVMSGYWGIRNFGKLDISNKSYNSYLQEFKNYLEGLK